MQIFLLCQRKTRLDYSLDSDIIYLSVLGNEFVILNSMDAVNDLFEKRSSIYSSR